jgi:hypothetical protein
MAEKGRFCFDSGVSETIGFIIIFGIVMTGIAIVTLYGYPALIQEQANANIKNMEKNMLVLQSDLKSLTFKSVPFQETAMQVSGGTLMIDKEPNVPPATTPYFEYKLGGGSVEHFAPGELHYDSMDGQATVTLENGAVHIRYWSSPTGSAMLAEPSWYYDEATDTYVIQMIRMNATDYMAQTGIGNVKMQLTGSNQTSPRIIQNGDYIRYYPSSEYHYGTAWSNYFKNPELKLTDLGSDKFTFNTGSKLIVKYYNVTYLSL